MAATLYFLKDRNKSVRFDGFDEAIAQSLLLAVRGIPSQVWNDGAVEPYTAPDWDKATEIFNRIQKGMEFRCSQKFTVYVYNESEFPPVTKVEAIVRELYPDVAFLEELSDKSWNENFQDFLDAYDAPDLTYRHALNMGQP